MKATLYQLGKILWPSGIQWHNLRREAFQIRKLIDEGVEPGTLYDFLMQTAYFRTSQKRAEILCLLNLLKECRPQTICEVGSYRGGTLALLSLVAHDSATIVSVDVNYPWFRRSAHRKLCKTAQRVVCLQADSHNPVTVKTVSTHFRGQALDFLLIDGDHSYDGVKSDFELFRPLMSPNGIIAFHDIALDYKQRNGVPTSADVGEVPRYWAELSSTLTNTQEFVENPEQDGFGIGVVKLRYAVESDRDKQ